MRTRLIFIISLFLMVAILGALILFWRPFALTRFNLVSPLGFPVSSPTPLPSPTKTATLALAGEIILARTVAERINHYRDYKYPFYKVKDILSSADLAFATLEAPLSDKNIPCPHGCMIFVGDSAAIEGIKFSGIDGVSLAANHIMDGGPKALEDTINLLEQNGIFHTGAGMNLTQAQQSAIKEVSGIKFAFLGYNSVPPQGYTASTTKPGLAWLEREGMVRVIKEVKKQADVAIVAFHWGEEYTARPNQFQREVAQAAIEAGADLVLGDHPHWVQGLEFYQDKLIIYGIGNFVFDQMWSIETRQGLIVLVTFENNRLTKIKLIPTQIEDFAQPRILSEVEGRAILDRIFQVTDQKSLEKLKSLQ